MMINAELIANLMELQFDNNGFNKSIQNLESLTQFNSQLSPNTPPLFWNLLCYKINLTIVIVIMNNRNVNRFYYLIKEWLFI